MWMIIGGAYQGKLEYAKSLYPDLLWIDGEKCTEEEVFRCGGIYHFHTWIRKMMEQKRELRFLIERVKKENPNLVIVTDEIGYGLVPVDDFERRYREEVGRICTDFAAFSERVDRVVSGIAVPIKGGDK